MFERKNNYPVILVSGFASYGENNSTQTIISDLGFPCHTPSFSTLSGTWDRACELYAQLVGGTVDYGAAHSQKYGHARYGKTYETPMVPNWGSLDDNGKIVKISLIAHGFGATVCRQFIELLYNGSLDERSVTPEESLSGLFKGGYKGLINCLVSLAGVNGGTTIFQAVDDKVPFALNAMTKACILRESLKLREDNAIPYGTREDTITQHGFGLYFGWSKDSRFLSALHYDNAAVDNYLAKTEDSIFADMGIDAMTKFNNNTDVKPDIYYLSAVGSVTKKVMNKITLPTLSAGLLAPTAALVSTYENYMAGKPVATPAYHENDGIVSTNSSLPPESDPATAFKDASICYPGTWYQIPIENKNHLSYIGAFERPDKYRNAIFDLMKIISNFETV